MKNFSLPISLLAVILVCLLDPQLSYSQCLVGDSNLIYTPNPSNTVEDNGKEYVKLYIHICERLQTDPTLSDAEVESIITQVNSDFLNAKIESSKPTPLS
jgi:hypothetical protein